MIVVSKAGAVAMKASENFEHKVAPSMGLRDVIRMKRDYLCSTLHTYEEEYEINGKTFKATTVEHVDTDLECPSDEEIDEYIRAREEYVAKEVLIHCGWDEFVKRCQLVGIEDYIDECLPCDGLGGQCNMACGHWNRCQGYIDIQ